MKFAIPLIMLLLSTGVSPEVVYQMQSLQNTGDLEKNASDLDKSEQEYFSIADIISTPQQSLHQSIFELPEYKRLKLEQKQAEESVSAPV